MLRCLPYILLASTLAGAVPADSTNGPTAAAKADQVFHVQKPQTGDQVTLKSGKTIHGVKILRATALQLVLEVLPRIEPLIIPARQVAAFQYGPDDTPLTATPSPPGKQEEPEDSRSRVLLAVKTSPELIRKMAAPISTDAVVFEQQDILTTLRDVAGRSGVTISIGPMLSAWPLKERITTAQIGAGDSFDDFIRESLARVAPWIAVEFDFDELHFSVRESIPSPHAQNEPGSIATGLK